MLALWVFFCSVLVSTNTLGIVLVAKCSPASRETASGAGHRRDDVCRRHGGIDFGVFPVSSWLGGGARKFNWTLRTFRSKQSDTRSFLIRGSCFYNQSPLTHSYMYRHMCVYCNPLTVKSIYTFVFSETCCGCSPILSTIWFIDTLVNSSCIERLL